MSEAAENPLRLSRDEPLTREMLNALCFLALPVRQKLDYLPPPFEPLLFHMEQGDLVTGQPLRFMAARCWYECQKYTAHPEADRALQGLAGLLDLLGDGDTDLFWTPQPTEDDEPELGGSVERAWDALTYLAERTLRLLGSEPEPPRIGSAELLDQYSHSEYSRLVGEG